MLRKISFSEVCKRLTDEGWGFDVYNGRCPYGGPYTLRGEYDTEYCYGSKTIAISFSHMPGFQFHHGIKKILVALNFICVQKVPWATGKERIKWLHDSKEIIGEDLNDGNLFTETYLAIDANLHKLSTDYLERIAMIDERPIGSIPVDFEIPPHAFGVNEVKYSINPCVTYINRDMTYWHNFEIVPNDIEDRAPELQENNEQDTNDYKFESRFKIPIVNANVWDLEMPTAEMNRFHIAVYKESDLTHLTPYVFGGSETVDDLMNRLNAYVKSVVKVNDYVKNNTALLKKANEYHEMKKEYDQKRAAFTAYRQKLEETSDRLVYDYQVKGQYHV